VVVLDRLGVGAFVPLPLTALVSIPKRGRSDCCLIKSTVIRESGEVCTARFESTLLQLAPSHHPRLRRAHTTSHTAAMYPALRAPERDDPVRSMR